MGVLDLRDSYGKRIYVETPNGVKLLGVCEGVSIENFSIDSVPDVSIKIDPTTDRYFYNPLYDMQSIYPQVYVRPKYIDAADSIASALELYRGERGNYKMNEIKNVTIKKGEFDDVLGRLTVEWDHCYVNTKTEFCTYGYTCISDTQKALATCFIMHRIGMKKLIFNDDVTIAIWDNKDKTIVRRNENEDYDMDKAFYMCVVKHMIGEKKSLSNLLKKWTPNSQ